jgi:protease-4
MAGLEELREAIGKFKQSGKFVVAYNEAYGQGGYYLASVADRIYLEPNGGLMWYGLSWNTMFYKGLLDKLGVKAEVFRPTACKYKSAVEPFILDRMSDANRRQMQQVVNSLWETINRSVSESRGIAVGELNRIADALEVTLPEEALHRGFVDSLVYEDYMQEVFASYGVEPGSRGEYEFVTLGDYATQLRADLKNVSSSQVAIVYADGAIVDGNGTGKDVYGNTLAEKLARVRRNDKVRAVVLRVNSPGGSALASDVIWREMELLQAGDRVDGRLCSQRRLLYLLSRGCDRGRPDDAHRFDRGIWHVPRCGGSAQRQAGHHLRRGAQQHLGRHGFHAAPHPRRTVGRHARRKVYTTFTRNVAAGRNLPLAKVLDIAQGRVWSGEDALGIGLIDTYGGLYAAIAIAADKAELGDDYRVTEVFDEPMDLPLLFQFFGAQLRSSFTRSELGDAMQTYERIQEAVSQQGVVMYCPYRMDLEVQ